MVLFDISSTLVSKAIFNIVNSIYTKWLLCLDQYFGIVRRTSNVMQYIKMVTFGKDIGTVPPRNSEYIDLKIIHISSYGTIIFFFSFSNCTSVNDCDIFWQIKALAKRSKMNLMNFHTHTTPCCNLEIFSKRQRKRKETFWHVTWCGKTFLI